MKMTSKLANLKSSNLSVLDRAHVRYLGRREFGKAALGLFSSLVWLTAQRGVAFASEGNPLLVAGFEVGQRMQEILNDIAVALDGIKDVETAQKAVKTFSDAEFRVVELEPFLLLLPHEGKTAIAAQVIGAIVIMKPTAEHLMADATIGPVLKPGFDKLIDKFKALGS